MVIFVNFGYFFLVRLTSFIRTLFGFKAVLANFEVICVDTFGLKGDVLVFVLEGLDVAATH